LRHGVGRVEISPPFCDPNYVKCQQNHKGFSSTKGTLVAKRRKNWDAARVPLHRNGVTGKKNNCARGGHLVNKPSRLHITGANDSPSRRIEFSRRMTVDQSVRKEDQQAHKDGLYNKRGVGYPVGRIFSWQGQRLKTRLSTKVAPQVAVGGRKMQQPSGHQSRKGSRRYRGKGSTTKKLKRKVTLTQGEEGNVGGKENAAEVFHVRGEGGDGGGDSSPKR